VPALSVEIVKQSHDTKGFVVLPRRWVSRHVAGGLTSMVTGKGFGEAWRRASGGFVYQIDSHRHRQARRG
jgi:hypothetical protein